MYTNKGSKKSSRQCRLGHPVIFDPPLVTVKSARKQIVLGAIHKGRPSDPREGGQKTPKNSGHLLLFSRKIYCFNRTYGGGGLKIPISAIHYFMDGPYVSDS